MGESSISLNGYRRENGLLWPDYDRRCAEVTFAEVAALMPVLLAEVEGRGVAVQAGGNCGQLVAHLAEHFAAVYTFEPDHRNFVALAVNTAGRPNVFPFRAALGSQGDRGKFCDMQNGDERYPANCGALYCIGRGRIPFVTIDDLCLSQCDLIALDIEGLEHRALSGAWITIRDCQPVILVEEKGLGRRADGDECELIEYYLSRCGYVFKCRVGNDRIYLPQ